MSPVATGCPRCSRPLKFAGEELTGCEGGCSLFLIRAKLHDEPVAAMANGHKPLATEPPAETSLPLGELLDELVGFTRRFVSMTQDQAVAVGLWTFHTHALDASQATPYLAITSAERESGKTLLLEVLNLLVANPWLTGRATAAVLPRKIDADRPTLLLDESDAAFKGDKDYAEALRGVLNTGYRQSGRTTVCVGQGADIGFRDFTTFCPKAIAGIGKLPDTVQSRSIPIRLKRKAPGETVERFRERDVTEQARPLCAILADAALSLVPALAPARPELPDELGDRAQDVWEPLLAIADAAGGDWPEQARVAARTLSAAGTAEDGSAGVLLLADVRAVFAERDTDRLPTEILLDALRGLEESPWSDWYGRPLAARSLARLLKPYGIGPHSDGTSRGYKQEAFEDAWGRYLPPQVSIRQEPAFQSEKQPISIRQDQIATDTLKSSAIPLPERPADALTDRTGGEGQ